MKRIRVLVLGIMAAIVCAASSLAVFWSINNREKGEQPTAVTALVRESSNLVIDFNGNRRTGTNDIGDSYYPITSAADFSGSSADTGGNTFGYLAKQSNTYFLLTNDIDLSVTPYSNFILGEGSILDGGKYNEKGELVGRRTITNWHAANANESGLFSRLYGTVRNIIFDYVNVNITEVTEINAPVGIVAASIGGPNVTLTQTYPAKIQNVTIAASGNGKINYTAENAVTGALVGTVSGDDSLEIINCENKLPVTAGNYGTAGGLIGLVNTSGTVTIQQTDAVAYDNTTQYPIQYPINPPLLNNPENNQSGTYHLTSGNYAVITAGADSSVGGFIGRVQTGNVYIGSANSADISGNANRADIIGGNYSSVGGLVGRNAGGFVDIKKTQNTGNISGGRNYYGGGLVGYGNYQTDDVSASTTTPNGEYLSTPAKDAVTGKYLITKASELATFQGIIPDADIVLQSDIDMSGYPYWTPITELPPARTFDGNGFAIKNLTILNGLNRGLFATIRGVAQNVTFTDVNIVGGDGTVNGVLAAAVGAAATDVVLIKNIRVETGKIMAGVSSVSGGLAGRHNYGGMTIENCYNNINITSGDNSVIGGILGQARNRKDGKTVTISNTYNTGNLTAGGGVSAAGGIFGNYYADTDYTNMAIRNTVNTGIIKKSAAGGTLTAGPIYAMATSEPSVSNNFYDEAKVPAADQLVALGAANPIAKAGIRDKLFNILKGTSNGTTAFDTNYMQVKGPDAGHFTFAPVTDNTEEESLVFLHSNGSYNSKYRFTILPDLGYAMTDPPTVSFTVNNGNELTELTAVSKTIQNFLHTYPQYLYTYEIDGTAVTAATGDIVNIIVAPLPVNTYTVTPTAGQGYTITADTTDAKYGTDFTFTVTADDHFNVSWVYIEWIEYTNPERWGQGVKRKTLLQPNPVTNDSNGMTFTLPGAEILDNLVIKAETVHEIYTVTPPDSGNFTFNGAATATHGSDYSFTVTAAAQHNITSVSYTINGGAPVTAEYTHTAGVSADGTTITITAAETEILGPIVITVTTAPEFYDVTAPAPGDFVFTGDVTAVHGTDYIFTVTPNRDAGLHYDINTVEYVMNGQTVPLTHESVVSQDGALIYSFRIPGADILNTVTAINVTTKVRQYNVNYTAAPDTAGFSEKAAETATSGTDFTFSLNGTIDPDYYIESVTVNGTPLYENGGTYVTGDTAYADPASFTIAGAEILGRITVEINTQPRRFNVTEPTEVNFEITDNAPTATHGTDYTFTINAAENYHITSVTVSSGEMTEEIQTVTLSTGTVTKSATYTIAGAGINNNIIISAATAPDKHTLTFTGEDNYEIIYQPTEIITYGTQFDFTVTPKPGYEILAVTNADLVDENSITKANSYQIAAAAITGDITVDITTGVRTYGVTAIYDGARTDFSAPAAATYLTDFTFSATVKGTGWSNAVTVTLHNGADTELTQVVANGGQYTVNGADILGDITITVITTQDTVYDVTLNNGNSATAGASTAIELTDYPFTVTADAHYYIRSVTYTVGGGTAQAFLTNNTDKTITAFTDIIPGTDIIGNIVITVTTAKIPYIITLPAGDANANISGAGTATNGTDYIFTAAPNNHYEINTALITARRANGTTVDITNNNDGTYTIAGADIKGDITITVPAATKIVRTVTFNTADNHYTVDAGAATATYGDTYTFHVTAANHYNITKIEYTIGGVTTTLFNNPNPTAGVSDDSYEHEIPGLSITADITITITAAPEFHNAVFEQGNYTKTGGGGAATFGTDYTFGISAKTHYTVTDVQYKIGTGAWISLGAGGDYTLPGAILTDAVSVRVLTILTPYDVTFTPDNYTVTNNAPTATHGNNYTFGVTPKMGYKIVSVRYHAGVGSPFAITENNGIYTIPGAAVTGHITVTVTTDTVTITPPAIVHRISFNFAGPNYPQATVTDASPTYTAGSGDYTFTVTANTHYYISAVTSSVAVSGSGNGTYTIAGGDIIGDIIITVTTAPVQYNITFGTGNYTATDTADVPLTQTVAVPFNAAHFRFKIVPAAGYEIAAVQYQIGGNGTPLYTLAPADGVYSIDKGLITDDIAITVTTAADNNPNDPTNPDAIYRVSFTAGTTVNYTVTGGTATATAGTPYAFSIKPHDYYGIAADSVTYKIGSGTPLSLTGTPNGGEYDYSIPAGSITADITITVTAVPLKYTVNAPAAGNFVFGGNTTGANAAAYKSPYPFTVTPNAGFHIVTVKYQIDGTDYLLTGTNNSYTIPGQYIIGDITIIVTTDSGTLDGPDDPTAVHTVSFVAGNYTVTDGAAVVTNGTAYTFTVTADDYYNIGATAVTYQIGTNVTWGNAVSTGNAGEYRIPSVTGNITIKVAATPKSYNVSFTGSNYTSTNTSNGPVAATARYLTDYAFRVTANANYRITAVKYQIGGAGNWYLLTAAGNDYTIPGGIITGIVTIAVTTESTAAPADPDDPDAVHTVSFVTGNYTVTDGAAVVTHGTAYTFSITAHDYYNIGAAAVTYQIGTNAPVTLTGTENNGEYDYSIPAGIITDDVTITVAAAERSYTITAPTETNFDFTGNGTATYKTPYPFTVTANTGYRITTVKYQIGGDWYLLTGTNNLYTIQGQYIIGAITIEVTTALDDTPGIIAPPAAGPYTVTFDYDEADVSVTGTNVLAYAGNTYSFTVTPTNSHHAVTVTASNGNIGNTGATYTVTNYTGPFTITITTAPKTYVVTLSPTIDQNVTFGGDFDPGNANNTVAYGDDYTFTVTPALNPLFVKSVEYTVLGHNHTLIKNTDDEYTIPGEMIIGDVVINIKTETTESTPTLHTVTFTTIGTVTIVGANEAPAGGNYLLAVTPNAGYRITSIIRTDNPDDPTPAPAVYWNRNGGWMPSSPGDINITAAAYVEISGIGFDTEIAFVTEAVTPQPAEYDVQFIFAGDGLTGLDSLSAATTTGQGDYSFTVSAKANYKIASVTSSVTVTDDTNGTYTIAAGDITGDIVITVTTTEATYNVLGDVLTRNEFTFTGPADPDTATYNTPYIFTATAKPGFVIANVSYRMNQIMYSLTPVGNQYIIPGDVINDNIVIFITTVSVGVPTPTEHDTIYNVTFNINGIDGTGAATVNAAATHTGTGDYTFTVTPTETYYHIGAVTMTINGVPYTDFDVSGNNYTIDGADIDGDIIITVNVTGAEFTVTPPAAGNYTTTASGGAALATTATYETDYTFTVTAANANYRVTAVKYQIGGTGNWYLLTAAGNDYTIPGQYIIGTVAIAVTAEFIDTPTAPPAADTVHNVTFNVGGIGGTGAAVITSAAATHITGDYTFTLTTAETYYRIGAVTMTINGAPYTGFTFSGNNYTIPGGAINGNIVINVNIAGTAYSVTRTPGNGFTFGGNATGANAAAYNTPYPFTVTAWPNFTVVDVEYSLDGANWYSLTPSGTQYTIPGDVITGNITIRVITSPSPAPVPDPNEPADEYYVTFNIPNIGVDTISNADATHTGTGTYTFTLTPRDRYTIAVWYSIGGGMQDVSISPNGSNEYTVTPLTAGDLTITVTSAPFTYEMTFESGNYNVTDESDGIPAERAAYNADYVFKMTPKPNYVISSVMYELEGEWRILNENNGRYTIPGKYITADITIRVVTAAATAPTPTIPGTVRAVNFTFDEGVLSVTAARTYSGSGDYTFTVILKSQYSINTVTGITYTEGNGTYTVSAADMNGIAGSTLSIVITTASAVHDVTFTGANATPRNPGDTGNLPTATTAAYNADLKFRIAADANYDITAVEYRVGTGKWISLTAVSGVYTIPKFTITDDVTIRTVTAGKTYTVTPPVNTDTTFAGDTAAQYGRAYTFTVTAKAGFTIGSVSASISGTNIALTDNGDGTYTITDNTQITGNIAIAVTTAVIPPPAVIEYTVALADTYTHFTTDIDTARKFNPGDNYTFTVGISPEYANMFRITAVGYRTGAAGDFTEIRPSGLEYTIFGITGNIEIQILEEVITYNVYLADGSDFGTFDITSDFGEFVPYAAYGTDYSFTVTAAENYASVSVTSASVTVTDNGDGTYTIPGGSIIGDITIEITSTPETYLATFTSGNYTKAAETGSLNIESAYSFTLTAHQFKNITQIAITIDGEDYKTYTYSPAAGTGNDTQTVEIPAGVISGHVAVTVTTAPEVYAVTFAGTNFGKSNAGATATYSVDYTFTLSAAPYYQIAINGVTADSGSVTHIGDNYTVTGFSDNFTITVTTEALGYNVTPASGNFTFTGDPAVAYGGTYGFSLTADQHYKIADVWISGSGTLEFVDAVDSVRNYTVTGFTGGFAVFASTDKILYNVPAPTDENFTFAGAGTATYGDDYTFTITPAQHRNITEITYTINGVTTAVTPISPDENTVTIPGQYIIADIEITAATETRTYTAIAPSAGNLVFTAATADAPYGTEYTFSVTANQYYQINQNTGVTVSNGTVELMDVTDGVQTYRVTNFTGNFEISVTVTEIPYTVKFNNSEQNTSAGGTAVRYLHDYSFTVTAKQYYNIKKITYIIGEGTPVEIIPTLTAGISADVQTVTIPGADIIGNIEITVETEAEFYTVSQVNTVGAVTPANGTAIYGADYELSVTAQNGYNITGISYTINGQTTAVKVPAAQIGASNTPFLHTIPASKILGDITVTVTTALEWYSVLSENPNAVVAFSNTAAHLSKYEFTVTANTHYKIDSMTIKIGGIVIALGNVTDNTNGTTVPTLVNSNIISTKNTINGERVLGNIEIIIVTVSIQYSIDLLAVDQSGTEITLPADWIESSKTSVSIGGLLILSAVDPTEQYKLLAYRIRGDSYSPTNGSGRGYRQIMFDGEALTKYADAVNHIQIIAIFVPKYELTVTNVTPNSDTEKFGEFTVYVESSPEPAEGNSVRGAYRHGDVIRIVVTPADITKQVNVPAIREQLLGLQFTDNAKQVTDIYAATRTRWMLPAGAVYEVSFPITLTRNLSISFTEPQIPSFNLAFGVQTVGAPKITKLNGVRNATLETQQIGVWDDNVGGDAMFAIPEVDGYRFQKWQISTQNGYRDISTLFENDLVNPTADYVLSNYFFIKNGQLQGIRFLNKLVTNCIVDGTITVVAVYGKSSTLTVSMAGDAALSPVDNNFAVYVYSGTQFKEYAKNLNTFNEELTTGMLVQVRYAFNPQYFVLNGISGLEGAAHNGNIIEFTLDNSRMIAFDITAVAISLHKTEDLGKAKGSVNYSFDEDSTAKIGDTLLIGVNIRPGYVLNSWTINSLAPTEIIGAEYNAENHSVQIPLTKEFMEWAADNMGLQVTDAGYTLTTAVAVTTDESGLLSNTYMGLLIAGPLAAILIGLSVWLILRKREQFKVAAENKARGYKPEPTGPAPKPAKLKKNTPAPADTAAAPIDAPAAAETAADTGISADVTPADALTDFAITEPAISLTDAPATEAPAAAVTEPAVFTAEPAVTEPTTFTPPPATEPTFTDTTPATELTIPQFNEPPPIPPAPPLPPTPPTYTAMPTGGED